MGITIARITDDELGLLKSLAALKGMKCKASLANVPGHQREYMIKRGWINYLAQITPEGEEVLKNHIMMPSPDEPKRKRRKRGKNAHVTRKELTQEINSLRYLIGLREKIF